MKRLIGAVAFGLCISAGSAADSPSALVPVDTWVARLGDPSFQVREAAFRHLAAEGPTVLPALERAADHPDAEVRRRAGGLADRLRRTTESAKVVAPPFVALDFRNEPLASAVAKLKEQTGVPLTLDPGRVTDLTRRITVRTAALPVWDAVAAFCVAAGLREEFREDLGGVAATDLTALRVNRFSNYGPVQAPPVTAGQVPIVLYDGRPAHLAGDRTTAVRVLALPPRFLGNRVIRGAGQIVLNLDVTPLPGLRWGPTTAVRVVRAEDAAGRPVLPSYLTEPRGIDSPYDDLAFAVNGQVVLNGLDSLYGPPPTTFQPNPRVIPVTLQTGDRVTKSLRTLEGVVAGEVTQADQPLVAVDRLAKAVGQVAHGPNELAVTVTSFTAVADGGATIKVRLDAPHPWAMQRFGRRPVGGGLNVGLPWEGGSTADPRTRFRFTDAVGERLSAAGSQTNRGDDGVRRWVEYAFTFPHSPSRRGPELMVFVGDKAVAVEVPFKLTNVPLP